MTDRTCSIEGCAGKLLARGWCNKHYCRWRAHGDPEKTIAPVRGTCTEDDCGRPAKAHGLCEPHYKSWKALNGVHCEIPDCSRPRACARYCQMHYRRWKKHGDPFKGARRVAREPDPSRTRRNMHGMKGSSEYRIWTGMKARCNNPNRKDWPRYGGRGITVCESWLKFENFYADMGPKPGPEYSIDRIDSDGNYDPGNCRWATPEVQLGNRSWRKSAYTPEQVAAMTARRAAGESFVAIAADFECSGSHVARLIRTAA